MKQTNQLELDFEERTAIEEKLSGERAAIEADQDLKDMLVGNSVSDFMVDLYNQKIYECHTPKQVRDWYNKCIRPAFAKLLSEEKYSLYISILASLCNPMLESPDKLKSRHGDKFIAFYEEHIKVGEEYLADDKLKLQIGKMRLDFDDLYSCIKHQIN